jgi:hypothetical protein
MTDKDTNAPGFSNVSENDTAAQPLQPGDAPPPPNMDEPGWSNVAPAAPPAAGETPTEGGDVVQS